MTTKGEAFAGLSVAITTPFRDVDVDYDTLRTQVEFQIAAGTTCLCPVGTTGESPTLSHEEHERVIAAVVQSAAGRIKVMPGTGSNSTAEALRLTKWAAKEGADAALMVAPLLQQADAGRLLPALQGGGRAVGIPICVYNIPGPDRQEHRAGNDRPDGRAAEHHDGQGSDRLARPGFADPGR